MKTKSIRMLLFAVIFNLFAVNSFAGRQRLPKRNPFDRKPPKSAPFDGGIYVLIGAGMAYALKMALDTKKKSINSKATS